MMKRNMTWFALAALMAGCGAPPPPLATYSPQAMMPAYGAAPQALQQAPMSPVAAAAGPGIGLGAVSACWWRTSQSSSEIKTSRACEPLYWPTMPSSAMKSMSRAARP